MLRRPFSALALLASTLPLGLAACISAPGPDDNASTSARGSASPSAHATAMTQVFGPKTLGDPLPDDAGAHLAISLRRQNEAALEALLRDQQDPGSPRFHAWLTPRQYGESFGLPAATYARVLDWLRAEGFSVTAYPNRLFVDATGTVAQVKKLLGVELREATADDQRRPFRSYEGDIMLPEDIAPLVLKVGGLDTRVRLRHRLDVEWYGSSTQALSADDLRVMYDIPTGDIGAQGLTLAVLGTQEGTQPDANAYPGAPFIPPDETAIQDYLTTLSHATATYNPIVLPNTDDDFDDQGSNSEYQLDVEMQSVAAPDAKELDLVLSPASVVFQTGAQYIANMLSQAVTVSTSLGLCESEEVGYDGGEATNPTSDAYLLRMAVQQGLAEGQTWFAASGDTGADDCNDMTSGTHNGFDGSNATVDFPCSAPEILCVGGTMFGGNGNWSASGALTAYTPEVVCNVGALGAAAGGGQSMLFKKPSYQTGVGPESGDGQRDLPDIALIAASFTPGVVDYDCGEGQDACPDAGTGVPLLDITGGTSVASPLAAGIFAHLAGDVGCRLGDIHSIIYQLGAAQQANPGPTQPFHDITMGNNDWVDPDDAGITGFSAGPGYDLASGWGSLDVKLLVAAWPSCGKTDGGALMRQDAARSPADAADVLPDATVHRAPDAGAGGGSGSGPGGGPGKTGGKDAGGGADDLGSPPPSNQGCGCVAAGAAPASSPRWLGPLAVLGLLGIRRRRARR
jgi:MYXO-CTERM domain-containing protein